MPDLTIQDVTLAILNGELDDDLDKIAPAVAQRLLDGSVAMRWRLEVPELDVEVTEDDLTLAMAKTVERLAKHSWAGIDPFRSAGDCSAIAVAVLHHRDGFSLSRDVATQEWVGDAVDKVDALPFSKYVDGLSTFQVSPAPLGQGSSTPTGPGSTGQPPNGSAG